MQGANKTLDKHKTIQAINEVPVWAEELPKNCPPSDAYEPPQFLCFRFAFTNPPTSKDFLSNRALYPDREFKVSECRARALSVFSSFSVARESLKLPLQRGKLIARIVLPPDAGLILQTGRNNQNHYSWWLRANFNPIPICTIVDEDSHRKGDE